MFLNHEAALSSMGLTRLQMGKIYRILVLVLECQYP